LILNTAFTNGYALPSSGARILRWVLLVTSVIGLGLLLIRTRRSRTRRFVGAR
jgi:hypothetical protein